MKYKLIFLFSIVIILLISSFASSRTVNIWDLDNRSDVEIIVFNENSAKFQEKINIINNLNESVEINTWIPILWPYDLSNNTEISFYPYQEWNKITNYKIIYVHVDDVCRKMSESGLIVYPNFFEYIKSYPMIPGFLFNVTRNVDEKTGYAIRTNNPTGLITIVNNTYSLFIGEFIEGNINTITVKIPYHVT